jgi:hypothetical protein
MNSYDKYPIATLSGVVSGGRMDIVLNLKGEPAIGNNVTVPIDDLGNVDWTTSAMSNYPWKITLSGQILACVGVVQTLVGSSYIALWKLYIRNINTSAPSSGLTVRTPAILEEYGIDFYSSFDTTIGVLEITFKTSSGNIMASGSKATFNKGAVRIAAILA